VFLKIVEVREGESECIRGLKLKRSKTVGRDFMMILSGALDSSFLLGALDTPPMH